MSTSSVTIPAEIDLESVDTFQAVLPESPKRAKNSVPKRRRKSTNAVFSVYKAGSGPYESASPRRKSSVHPRVANKLISRISSNTLLESGGTFGVETREVDSWSTSVKDTKAREKDVWSAVALTPERQKLMIFSVPYIDSPAVISVRNTTT